MNRIERTFFDTTLNTKEEDTPPGKINELADETLSQIFSYLTGQSAGSIAPVSHRFREIFYKKEIWKVFYNALGYRYNLFFLKTGENYRKIYSLIHTFRRNYLRNQFVLEENKEQLVPVASSYDLCCFKEPTSYTWIVKNIWNKQEEFTFLREPPTYAHTLLKTIGASAFDCFLSQTEGDERAQNSLKETLRKFSETSEDLKKCIQLELHEKIDQFLKSSDPLFCSNIWTICLTLSPIVKKIDVAEVKVNSSYCIVHFQSGFVEVWDRQAKEIILTIVHSERKSFGFLNKKIGILLHESRRLVLFDTEQRTYSVVERISLFACISSEEYIVFKDNEIVIKNVHQERVEKFYASFIRDFSYDSKLRRLAVLEALGDHKIMLAIYELKKGRDNCFEFELMHSKLELDYFPQMKWHAGNLLLHSNCELKKVIFCPDKSLKLTYLWADHHGNFKYIWEGEKLHIVDVVTGKRIHLNYFVDFEKVAEDLIKGYTKNLDPILLESRFLGFPLHHQQGIYDFLIQEGIQPGALGWSTASNHIKANCIQLYLLKLRSRAIV